MSGEIIYPRISAIWFGNTLDIWVADLSMSLFIVALGYLAGSHLLKKKRRVIKPLLLAYFISAAFYAALPLFYSRLLDGMLALPVVAGAYLFAWVFMIPTMGLLAFTSPLLVSASAAEINKGASFVFGLSTLSGAIAMPVVGTYFLPYFGIRATCWFISCLLTGCFLMIYRLRRR